MSLDSTVQDPGGGHITWLERGGLKVFRDGAGQPRATVVGVRSVIRPAFARSFPITAPHLFIELREEGGDAVGMLRSLDDLDAGSRAIAEELLRERYVVPRILEILNIRQEFGSWVWAVVTDRGERAFTIRSPRDDIRPLPSADESGRRVRRIRITDVDGGVFEIRDYAALDAHSRALFEQVA